MTDFQVQTGAAGVVQDTRWRISAHGEASARTGQLAPSTLTPGTHYDAATGVVPSGLPVTRITSGANEGLYKPWSAGDPDATPDPIPADSLDGFVNDNYGVQLGNPVATSKPTFAVLVHGIINPAFVPVDAGDIAALKGADSTGLFTFQEG